LESLRGKDHLEDLVIDGRIILKFVFMEVGWEGVNWIHLDQDMDHWQAIVYRVMNLQVLLNARNYLIS
jgi:hypothetical protein